MFHFFQFPKFDEFWNFKKVLIYQLSLVRVHCMSIYIFYTVHTYNVRVQCAIWENFQETNRFSSSRDQRSSRVSRRFQPVQANESNQKNPIWDQLTSKLLCWPWKGPLKKAQVYSQSLFKFSFMKQFVSLCGKLHTLWEVNKIKWK